MSAEESQPESEPTLGELLSAVLTSVMPDDEPDADDMAARAQYLSAWELSDQLASLFAVSPSEVFDALCTVPDDMLPLLESPEGWTALGGYIAADFQVPIISYHPTIH